jgi:hypothetical protein
VAARLDAVMPRSARCEVPLATLSIFMASRLSRHQAPSSMMRATGGRARLAGRMSGLRRGSLTSGPPAGQLLSVVTSVQRLRSSNGLVGRQAGDVALTSSTHTGWKRASAHQRHDREDRLRLAGVEEFVFRAKNHAGMVRSMSVTSALPHRALAALVHRR